MVSRKLAKIMRIFVKIGCIKTWWWWWGSVFHAVEQP